MGSVRLTVVPVGGDWVPMSVMLGDEIALVATFREDDVVDFTVSVPVFGHDGTLLYVLGADVRLSALL